MYLRAPDKPQGPLKISFLTYLIRLHLYTSLHRLTDKFLYYTFFIIVIFVKLITLRLL